MNKNVRVRFAPSPTGNLHVGGLRTALFNWLFARHHGGTFLIRVEDTDLERSSLEYVASQLASLAWVGITSDEPSVYQSQRTDLYQSITDTLLREKKVYKCYCSAQDIEDRVRAAGIAGEHYAYDGHCRARTTPGSGPYVVRFALPDDFQSIEFNDVIRGTVTVERDQLDDFIIIRSDGSFTYNFVVVIDDHDLAITHVIRAEEHISNTPKQLLLYAACGYKPPVFAHIPMILGPDGSKLSKRDGAVDVLSYKKEGYLPEAFINYLVRLGWAHGDQEIFSVQDMIAFFSLENVGKKGAIFDRNKLDWVNTVYLKEKTAEQLVAAIIEQVDTAFIAETSEWTSDQREKAVLLYKERSKTLKELRNQVVTLYTGPTMYVQEDIQQWVGVDTHSLLDHAIHELKMLTTFDHDAVAECLKKFCKVQDLKLVTVAQPLRLALTGSTASPGIFDLLALVGKEETIKRVAILKEFITR